MPKKIKCALIGPGNIGTDLLAKLQRSAVLEPVWMVGIDPESDGLKRARAIGIKTTADGVDGLVPHMHADGVQIDTVDVVRLALSHTSAEFLYLPDPDDSWAAVELSDQTLHLSHVAPAQ